MLLVDIEIIDGLGVDVVDKFNSVPDTIFANELGVVNKKRIFKNSSQTAQPELTRLACVKREGKADARTGRGWQYLDTAASSKRGRHRHDRCGRRQ